MPRTSSAAALVLLVAACSSTPQTVALNAGIYTGAAPVKVGAGDETQMRLTLRPDGDAAVQVTFPQRPATFFAQGRWQESGDRIVIEVPAQSQRMVFSRSGDQLVAREWDRSLWGEADPPVLYRRYR
jgi:hypothetical protein